MVESIACSYFLKQWINVMKGTVFYKSCVVIFVGCSIFIFQGDYFNLKWF